MFASNPSPSSSSTTSPLLSSSIADNLIRSRRLIRQPPRPLRGAASFLRRASGRRMRLRDSSLRVRESAAEHLETGWAYSRPVVVLDLLWNTVLFAVGLAALLFSSDEAPDVPLRVWIGGYALQCAVHMFCVAVECTPRRRVAELSSESTEEGSVRWERSSSGSGSDESEDYGVEESLDYSAASFAKNLESGNTMFSFIWWILGFYWVTAGGESLVTDSPQLYWITITFLALDVVFVVICVAVALLIGIAVCFCLPCIIAILYVVTDQEGATKEEIDHLPKYKFRKISDFEKVNREIQVSFGGIMTECDTDAPTEHALSQEDAECCICLCSYDDGTELRELPCCHHFHCTCIDKWLQINATCPLCKFNILKSAGQSSSEDV